MKYTITIAEQIDNEKYGKTVYEQTVDNLDIPQIIAVVNNIPLTPASAKKSNPVIGNVAHGVEVKRGAIVAVDSKFNLFTDEGQIT